MQKKNFLAFFLTLFLITTVLAPAALAYEPAPEVVAQRVFMGEPASGEIIYEKNPDEQATPASLTKVMTALIVLEEADMDDIAVVSQSALDGLHPESSIADLKVGEEMSVENLLKCVLIASANDACNVLAEHLYGSVEGFVDRMNERASELGCTNTHFVNTHGLTEDGHHSTARDMYKITLEALTHPEFLEICNTARVEIPATNKNDAKVFLSTNYLISALKNPDYVYYYAKGIKTGHTSAAGYCLISSAEKDDVYYLLVVMGSERDEETGRIGSFDDSKALYEWAFANYKYQTLLQKNTPVSELPVSLSSEVDYVTLVPDRAIDALLPNDFKSEDVKLNVTLDSPDGVQAPVARGQKLGSAEVTWRGRSYGTVELVALGEAKLDKTLEMQKNVGDFFSQKWVIWILVGIGAVILLYIIFVIALNVKRRRRRMRSSNYRGSRRRRSSNHRPGR